MKATWKNKTQFVLNGYSYPVNDVLFGGLFRYRGDSYVVKDKIIKISEPSPGTADSTPQVYLYRVDMNDNYKINSLPEGYFQIFLKPSMSFVKKGTATYKQWLVEGSLKMIFNDGTVLENMMGITQLTNDKWIFETPEANIAEFQPETLLNLWYGISGPSTYLPDLNSVY